MALEPRDVREEVLLGEDEVLLHQPVGRRAERRTGDHLVVALEAHGLDGLGRQPHRPPRRVPLRQQHHAGAVAEERLVERVDHHAVAVEVEAQAVEAELGERPGAALDAQPQHGDDIGGGVEEREAGGALERRLGHRQRPEGHRIAGAEAAEGLPLGGVGEQRRVLRDDVAAGQLPPLGIDLEGGDGHRGDGIQVVGMEDVEQLDGDLGELAVEVLLDAGGEEGERLDEALDVGVRRDVGPQLQPPGHLGVGLGERRPHVAQVGQLAPVGAQQLLAGVNRQRRPPPRCRS